MSIKHLTQPNLLRRLNIHFGHTQSVVVLGERQSGKTQLVCSVLQACQEQADASTFNGLYFSKYPPQSKDMQTLSAPVFEMHVVRDGVEAIDILRASLITGTPPSVVCFDDFDMLFKGYSPYLVEHVLKEHQRKSNTLVLMSVQPTPLLLSTFNNRSSVAVDHTTLLLCERVQSHGQPTRLVTVKQQIPLESTPSHFNTRFKSLFL